METHQQAEEDFDIEALAPQEFDAQVLCWRDMDTPTIPEAPETSEEGEPLQDLPSMQKANHVQSIRTLHSSVNLRVEQGLLEVSSDQVKALERATFKDVRWDNARRYLRETDVWNTAAVRQLIRNGAKSFGFWHLADEVLDTLAGHVLGDQPAVSQALQAWMDQEDGGLPRSRASERIAALHTSVKDVKETRHEREGRGQRRCRCSVPGRDVAAKAILCTVAFIISNVYALDVVLNKYPGIMEFFSWKIYVARACGMATLVWTSFLFFSMSRTLHRALLARLPANSALLYVANEHKELHIFCGKMLMGSAFVHVLAHALGTVPGIARHTKDELNELLGCANPDTTKGYIGMNLKWLQWPACPLQREFTYEQVLFMSTIGLSGIALVAALCAVGYTGRKAARSTHFDRFWHVHNFVLVLWPLLLFVHGSNGWVGAGCPLIFLTALPFVLSYSVDRALRLLRYYLFSGGAVAIQEAVIRPGRGGGASGALTCLMIKRPPFLWCNKFKAGMYAFVNMPEYAPAQWHPFSICSGPEDETLQFIIQGVGDWTQELARQCMEAYEKPDQATLPRVAVDGPYLAPTATALSREVIVAVGAGVGITPFLSLLSAIITALTGDGSSIPLREAHFFWMTRSADELLFGRRLFTKIVSHPDLRDKVFLHLHVTQRAPDGDVAAYLFRQAVKRQSELDRSAFRARTEELAARELGGLAAVVPWSWVNCAKEDVLWVRCLLETADANVSEEVEKAHTNHWSAGVASCSTIFEAPERAGSSIAQRFRMKAKGGSQSATKGLFSGTTCLSTADFSQVSVGPTGFGGQLPVVFGRPDFMTEVAAVGRCVPDKDVHVYVCGNDALVASLQQVCQTCAKKAKAEAKDRGQKYVCHFERFG